MTQVIVRWANDLPTGVFARDVVIRCVPTQVRELGTTVVLPEGFTASGPAPLTIELAPTTNTWLWRVDEKVRGGRRARYLAVPDSAFPVEYADLVEVDPNTLDPLAEPEAAWWVALNQVVVEAGAITPEQVDAKIEAHRTSQTPHPVYDLDMIDMATVFENGLI